jgi:hypothetical protein
VQDATKVGRARPDVPQQRPAHSEQRDQHGKHDEGAEHRGLGNVVLPLDDDGARPIGQPMQAGGNGEDAEQEEDETHHRRGSVPVGRLPASDDLSWPSMSAIA